MSVLISDPNIEWSQKILTQLEKRNYSVDISGPGKDYEKKIQAGAYRGLIYDFDQSSTSPLEMLRNVRLSYPGIKVILTFTRKERLQELGISEEDLKAVGATEVLAKPYSLQVLADSLEGTGKLKLSRIKSCEEVTIPDTEFTQIKVDAFFSSNTTIFDLYIRLGSNKYVQILHKGDYFDEEQLQKYTQNESVQLFYFKTKDRIAYINYTNELLAKAIKVKAGSNVQRVNTTRSVVDKYIEEIFTTGINAQLVQQGRLISQNIYNMVQRDREITKLLHSFEDYDSTSYAHQFLVSFYAAIISKHLDWASNRTVEIVAFAGLFHDIGMLKLPELQGIKVSEMTPSQLALYKQHPKFGYEILGEHLKITEPIKQIVYQHHERVNGRGFPNGLTGLRIYPLSKINAVADAFTELLVRERVTPIQGLKMFLSDKSITDHFDAQVLTALVRIFRPNID